MLAVVEVSIGSPDAFQHFYGQREGFDGAEKRQALVAPVLAEVAVHGVFLETTSQTGRATRKRLPCPARRPGPCCVSGCWSGPRWAALEFRYKEILIFSQGAITRYSVRQKSERLIFFKNSNTAKVRENELELCYFSVI